MTPRARERPHTWPGHRGSCSTTLQKPKGTSWVHSPSELARVQWGFKISMHTPLIRTPANLITQPASVPARGSFFCYEFVCAKPSGGLHAVRRRAEVRRRGLWHCGSITLAFPVTLRTTEDGSPVWQKIQEIAQIFPTGCLPGNPSQHRRWTARLPSRAQHRPRR